MTDAQDSRPVARGLAAVTFLLMAGNLLSRVLGLVREQLTSGLFGAGNEIAAFTVADNVNTLLFDLMINGMLQAALVPVLAQWAMPEKREEFRRISGALLTFTFLVLSLFAALGTYFAPTVVRMMTALGGSGDARGAETTALTIDLVRIILPSIVLLGVGSILMGSLYALERMTVPALSTGARNACVVLSLLLFSGSIGIKSLPLGVVAGAAVMAIMQLPALKQAGAMPRLNLSLNHPAIKQIMMLYWPIFLGLIVSTVAVVVDRNLAWGAEEDALGAMRYATTLVQLVMGLVGAAVSLASLPALSRHFNEHDEDSFQATLGNALRLVTALIVPAVFGLAAISSPIVELLFHHGETSAAQSRSIVIALLGYLPGHFFAAFDQVLIFSFYARRNTRTPVLVGLLSTGIYFVTAFGLVQPFGMLGLVLANSTQFAIHAIVMYLLARSVFGLRDEAMLWRTLGRCGIAGGMMALVVFAFWQLLNWAIPHASGLTEIAREIALVAVPAAVGIGVYVVLSIVLRIDEVSKLVVGIANKLGLIQFLPARLRT